MNRSLAFLAFLLVSELSIACTPGYGTWSNETIHSYDNLLYAEVTYRGEYDQEKKRYIDEKDENGNYSRKITLKVKEVFKGQHKEGDILNLRTKSSSCSLIVGVGKSYLFFYNESEQYLWLGNSLSSIRQRQHASELLNELRAVNQALKAQPSAAGTSKSGAP